MRFDPRRVTVKSNSKVISAQIILVAVGLFGCFNFPQNTDCLSFVGSGADKSRTRTCLTDENERELFRKRIPHEYASSKIFFESIYLSYPENAVQADRAPVKWSAIDGQNRNTKNLDKYASEVAHYRNSVGSSAQLCLAPSRGGMRFGAFSIGMLKGLYATNNT